MVFINLFASSLNYIQTETMSIWTCNRIWTWPWKKRHKHARQILAKETFWFHFLTKLAFAKSSTRKQFYFALIYLLRFSELLLIMLRLHMQEWRLQRNRTISLYIS